MNISTTVQRVDGQGRAVSVTVGMEAQEQEVGARLARLLPQLASVIDGALGGAAPQAPVRNATPAPVDKQAAVAPAPTNGNGNGSSYAISQKQKSFLMGLAAKSGLKVAGVNEIAREITGRANAIVNDLSKTEASAVIEILKGRLAEEAA